MLAKKILRFELIILSLISLCCLFFVIFNLENSDNYFAISSHSNFSVISYYITSLLAGIYFYIGPWIVFSLIFFGLIYFKVFRDRENHFDPLFIISLILGVLGVFYLTLPSFLGAWITMVKNKNLLEVLSWVAIVLSVIFCLAIIFEKKPHRIVLSFFRLIKFSFLKVYGYCHKGFMSVKKAYIAKKEASIANQEKELEKENMKFPRESLKFIQSWNHLFHVY